MKPAFVLVAVAAIAGAAVAAAAAAPNGDAATIARAGLAAKGIPACLGCHGLQGQGAPSAGGPRLAHLDRGYLERQLDSFAAGRRRNDVMAPIAQRLTQPQRAALAAYFAGLPPPALAAGAVDQARLARGRELALDGDWSVKAPACAACHGPDGQGVGSLTPPLIGQTQDYLLRELKDFRNGERSGPLGLMAGVARRLSQDDLRAAAAYYASLPFPARSSRAAGARP